MQIDPGIFNKKIQIIEQVVSKDDSGFKIIIENILLTIWAQITNQSGKEIITSGSDFREVKTRFLMRTPKIKIDKDYVIKLGERVFEIIYINDYNLDKNYTEIITKLVIK